MSNENAQAYLQKKKVSELFESLLTGLLFHQPDNHISYLEECLATFRHSNEPIKWNTFMAMPWQPQGFGVAPTEHRIAAATTPLPPIAELHTTFEDEAVRKSPATLDTKTVLPPINSEHVEDTSEKIELVKSSSSIAEPLPPITSPFEVKDNEATRATLSATENSELTLKENITLTGKQVAEMIKASSSIAEPLPPISGLSEVKVSEATEVKSGATESNELTKKENITPLPPIAPRQVQFGDVYFVLGGPGSGKGTQCAQIVDKFGFVHLSTGDLFRAEVKKETELGQMIANIINEGGLVPSDITVSLLKDAMLKRDQANGFLIDGFPREMEQAKIFEENVCPCAQVLLFKCSDEVMTERLKQRGLTSGRTDDDQETIRKRLETFHQHTIPVISYYQQDDKVWEVNAECTVEEVFSKVERLFSGNSQEKSTSQENLT